ncbi:MAG: hypothetical protein ACKVPY_13090 [Paracoccaceae bacterium]
MAGTKKPGNAGSRPDTPPLPYTEERKQTHAFAREQRTVKTGGSTEKRTNYEIMLVKQF